MTNQSSHKLLRQSGMRWNVGKAITSVALAAVMVACKPTQSTNPYPGTRSSQNATQTTQMAQIDPRSLHRIWLAADKTLRDDHWGECPARTHYHALELIPSGDTRYVYDYPRNAWSFMDGLCHDDVTDQPVEARPKLPKFKPDPKATWV